LHGTLLPLR